jgi:hypothetical protein
VPVEQLNWRGPWDGIVGNLGARDHFRTCLAHPHMLITPRKVKGNSDVETGYPVVNFVGRLDC